MRFAIEKRPPASAVHAIWGPLAIGAVAFIYSIRDFLQFSPPCYFKEFTGIPCLTCGSTRSALALAGIDIAASFFLNPLFVILVFALIVLSVAVSLLILLRRDLRFDFSSREKLILRLAVIAVVLINWLYLILARV